MLSMTKGNNGKPNILGRFIFGEKRKQHASLTRKSNAITDNGTFKKVINIHDWSIWRMRLNEQMSLGILTDQQNEIKQMREYLRSNAFYQKYNRHNAVQLLFSIPRAKFQPEFFEQLQEEINKSRNNEIAETIPEEQKHVRSNSDERSASVTSVSALQPSMLVEKTINRLSSKGVIGNTGGGFVQVNERMIAADGIRSRRTDRNSFKASDHIHSTIGKAVKDGNVLEKIKAFEMQAAAAQAESAMKSSTINHRIQAVPSAIHRTLSPNVVHPISPNLIRQFSFVHSNRTRHIHPMQHPPYNTYESIMSAESHKGTAHVLEALHGDVILKRRTSSQKTLPDEDYSMTAMNSMSKTASNGNSRHRHPHHRTSKSRSKHRQEIVYGTHKHSSKSKRMTTPPNKSSLRRRWLKGQKNTPTESSIPIDKLVNKSHKTLKLKKKPSVGERVSSDNNRVYGVPKADQKEHSKNESTLSQYLSAKMDEKDIQQRSNRKSYQQNSSNSDIDLLNKVNEDKLSRPFEIPAKNKDDLFIKNTSTIVRHQSIIHLSHSQAKTSSTLRRYASQYSTNERRSSIQPSKESLEIPSSKNQPSTFVTPQTSSIPDEQNLYETPHSEHIQTPISNTHTLKKKRSFHTITTTTNNNNRKQISKQILHAIMNSMNNKDSSTISPTINEAFFENGPHTNPEEIITRINQEVK